MLPFLPRREHTRSARLPSRGCRPQLRVEALEPRVLLANWSGDVFDTTPGTPLWTNTEVQEIVGDVHVPAGKTLTIQQGTVIRFASGRNLTVDGTLTASGSADQTIFFTSYRDSSPTGGSNNAGAGDWGSITFNPGSIGNVLDHTEVRYGGYSGGNVPAQVIASGPLTLTNSVLRDSYNAGLRIVGSSPTVTGVTFQNNYWAATMDLASSPVITAPTVQGNTFNAVVLDGGSIADSANWNSLGIAYLLSGNVTVTAGTTLTLGAGQVVKSNGTNLIVNGTLNAAGTAASPIVFTSYRDDTAGGDTNNDGNSAGIDGDWGAITFNPGSDASRLDHVSVRYGGYSDGGAAVVIAADIAMNNSTFRNSYNGAVRINNSNPTLTNDSWQDNYFAVSMDLASSPVITNPTLLNNTVNGVLIDSGTLPASNTWDNPGIVYELSDHVTIPAGITLTIVPGQVVKFANNHQGGTNLFVNGTLHAAGTAALPIIFTSYRDDTVGGDTNNDGGNLFGSLVGDWGAIQFGSGSTGNVIDHAELRYGGFYDAPGDPAMLMVAGSLTLSSSIVRDAGYDGIVVSPGASATLKSNLFLHNHLAGVHAQAGATLTAVNNTIDGNDYYGVHLDSPTATLINNSITNNDVYLASAGIYQTGPTNLTMSFNNVFNPRNRNYTGLPDQTGTNGNISVDPRYFNRANLQYQLRPGSPVEDAGTSNGAPATDFLGNPRFDDPNITGRGDGSGYDMGGIEVQEVATSTIDLATLNVTGPTTGTQGMDATINWTVKNIGTSAATGSWSDAIYLSDTPAWSINAKFLKRVTHTGDLGPGQSYDASTSVTLNNVLPGNHYFIVRGNDLNEVFEGLATANNSSPSQPISFAMPTLTLNTPFNDQFTGAGQAKYYQIMVAAGQTLSFALQSAAGSGAAELYVSRGAVPSRSQFDFSATALSPNQQVVVPTTQQGTYYVLAYSAFGAAASSAFSLTAGQPVFGVQGVSPNTVGNSGQVTLTIQGALFTAVTQASLIAPDNSVIPAVSIQLEDSTKLHATFDLSGKPTGTYGVRVTKEAQTASAAGALTVTAGIAGHLYTHIDAPGAIRKGRAGVLTITYGNDGGANLAAPLLVVQSSNALLQHPGQPALPGSYLDFLGISSTGPAGVLPPGAESSIQLKFVGLADDDEIQLSVTQTNRATTFDWASVKDQMRPSDVPADAWNAIYANFLASVGSTSGDYEDALARTATYLSRLGDYTADVSRLLKFEFIRAGDFGAIAERYHLGALGRGWQDPTDIAAVADPAGNVLIHVGGSVRPFFRQSNGAFLGLADEAAMLTLAGGIYQLHEPDGSLTVFHADGTLNYTTDATGARITAGYAGTHLTGLTDSFSNVTTLSYNGQGRLSTITDPVGHTSTFTYDAGGEHLLSIATSEGTTQFTYVTGQSPQTEHAIQSVSYPDGTHLFYTYDSLGRVTKTAQDNGANELNYSYDSTGGITTTDVLGHSSTTLVNDFGQPAIVQDPLGNITRYFYDSNGALVQAVGPDGSMVTITPDSRGNPTAFLDSLGQRIQATFDGALNTLQTLRDARGNTLSFRSDAHGNTLSLMYPDGKTDQYSYDAAGNVTSSTNRGGNQIHYTYDAHNLVVREDFGDGGHNDFTYDAHRNLATATNAVGTTTYAYDPTTDRLNQVTYPDGRYLKFTYDAAGRRKTSVDQGGFTINYDYDNLGRLQGLTDANNATIVTYTYDEIGRMKRQDMGNGTSTSYAYDSAGHVTSIVNRAPAPGSVVLLQFDYTYDAAGRVLTTTTADGTTNYGYDVTGQLASVSLPGGRLITYQYDAAGNRIAVNDNGATTNYATNNLNQYTTVGSAQLAYDANGNLIKRTDASGTTTYSYNLLEQLDSVTTPTDSYSYVYDAVGNRIASIHNGVRTNYLVDPAGLSDVVAEYAADGQLIAHYTQGAGLTSRVEATGAAHYFAFDAIGNTSLITAPDGSVGNRYTYLPFGETLSATESVPNSFTFGGRFGVMHEGHGLYFMRARYFDPGMGRFTAMDPIGPEGGLNLYTYTGNDPLTRVDPTGTTFYEFLELVTVISRKVVYDMVRDEGVLPTIKNLYLFERGLERLSPQALLDVARRTGLPAGYSVEGYAQRFAEAAAEGRVGKETILAKTQLDRVREINKRLIKSEAIFRGGSRGSIVKGFASFRRPSLLSRAVRGLGVVGMAADSFATGYAVGTYINNKLPESVKDTIGETLLLTSQDHPWLARPIIWIIDLVSPVDPNDIFGPKGFGSQHFVTRNQTFPYIIHFENKPTATAPALVVAVTQQLDANLDWSTFELGNFGFGKYIVEVPAGRRFYSTRVDATDTRGEFVDVTAEFDPNTGKVTWTFTSVDPATGALPEGVTDGFLPPEDGAGSGQGFVTYRVRPKANLTTGTTVPAQGRVIFEAGLPDESFLDTPVFTNTFDATAPASAVTALPANSPATFTVSWSGDDTGGSGIARYDVLVSDNDGPFTPWQTGTTQTSATFTGTVGHTYAFYSVATDNVGFRESTPAGAQATTLVTLPPAPPSPPTSAPPPPATPASPSVVHPVGVILKKTRKGGRKVKLSAQVASSNGSQREIVVPYQAPGYTAIAASLHDGDGDGTMDSVLFTARKGKKRVQQMVAL